MAGLSHFPAFSASHHLPGQGAALSALLSPARLYPSAARSGTVLPFLGALTVFCSLGGTVVVVSLHC